MAITGKIYGLLFTQLFNKEIDILDDTVTVIGTTSAHTPDQDAHNFVDDITNEVAGGGYSRKTLANDTVGYTGGTNVWKYDGDDVQWTTATFTVRNFHLADTTPGSDATRPLICYQTSDADITGGGGNFDLIWNASGIMTITVA